jgi:flagellar capping protein FliD
MSNPYKEGQTHMSRRRPPHASSAESSTQSLEAGPLPPVPSSTYEASSNRHNAVPAWLAPILQGVTVVILIGFAFWFGGLNKTVEQTAKTVEELRASKESMGNRLTAIETELRAIETELRSTKESVNNRLTSIETKLDSMNQRSSKR